MENSSKRALHFILIAVLLFIFAVVAYYIITEYVHKPGELESESETRPAIEDVVHLDSIQYTYEKMQNDISHLEKMYPDILFVRTAGHSADGREIYELSVGKDNASTHILLHAGIHAREYLTTLILMKQIDCFCAAIASNESYNNIRYCDFFENICCHFVPMVNPDGIALCQSGPEAIHNEEIREIVDDCYMRESGGDDAYWLWWKANGRGVDLNRNFDAEWEGLTAGPTLPSSRDYKGTAPASEPETQALIKLAQQYSVKGVISYHTAGGLIYCDYSEGEAANMENELVQRLASASGFEPASADSAAGCSNYFGEVENIPCLTVEMAAGYGGDDYPLPDSVLFQAWEETQLFLPEIASAYLSETISEE